MKPETYGEKMFPKCLKLSKRGSKLWYMILCCRCLKETFQINGLILRMNAMGIHGSSKTRVSKFSESSQSLKSIHKKILIRSSLIGHQGIVIDNELWLL